MWADTPWDPRDFPLLGARGDHVDWVRRVLDIGAGRVAGIEEFELRNPHVCRFGQWYDGHGSRRCGHLPSFGVLGVIHQRVHEVGTQIVEAARAEQWPRAAELSTELVQLRQQVSDNIRAIQEVVFQSAQPEPFRPPATVPTSVAYDSVSAP